MDDQHIPRKSPGKPQILTGDTAPCYCCEAPTNHYLKNLVDPTAPAVPICGTCSALCEPIEAPEKFSQN